MQEFLNIASSIKRDIEVLSKSVSEMKKTHAQVLSEEWITKDQVMQILKIGTRTFQKLKSKKVINYSKINGICLYRASEIESLLTKNYGHK